MCPCIGWVCVWKSFWIFRGNVGSLWLTDVLVSCLPRHDIFAVWGCRPGLNFSGWFRACCFCCVYLCLICVIFSPGIYLLNATFYLLFCLLMHRLVFAWLLNILRIFPGYFSGTFWFAVRVVVDTTAVFWLFLVEVWYFCYGYYLAATVAVTFFCF